MMNVKEFIKAIQKHPQMFVHEVRTDYIEYMICGFICGNSMHKGADNIDHQFRCYFDKFLVAWIKKNVDRKYEQQHFSWSQILKDVIDDETEAVELFFHLCDKFFEEYEKRCMQCQSEEQEAADEWGLRWRNLCQHEFAHANPTSFKYDLERAFGNGKEEHDEWWSSRVARYLYERELAGCRSETDRWRALRAKVDGWLHSDSYIDWKEDTYICGVYGWNVELTALRLPFPQQFQTDTEYDDWLYYVTAIVLFGCISNDSWDRRTKEKDRSVDDWVECYVEHGYFPMTSAQWIAELRELRWLSWESWQKEGHADTAPDYIIAMNERYLAYDAIIDRLEREAAGSEVVCINQYGENVVVWYFARATDSLFVVQVSDYK
ncbi:MAG: hypothetical protein K2N44_05270 [Lachnospiraceae bacterium]|nr:hypothetical protein [Lachnospiraceae bacterium]